MANRFTNLYHFRDYFPRSLAKLRSAIKSMNDFDPVEKQVKPLLDNNQPVRPDLLTDYNDKKLAFHTDLEALQAERRVVVENLDDAEGLCKLARGTHRWKFDVLVHDDNPGPFKTAVHKKADAVDIHVHTKKDNVLKKH